MIIYALSTILSTFFSALYSLLGRLTDRIFLDIILKRVRIIFYILSFIVIFCLSAFRFDVGIDYGSYSNWFDKMSTGIDAYFEPLFLLTVTIIQLFTDNTQWLFIVSSAITIGFIFASIHKQSSMPALSVFLFCTMGFLSHSFNLIRQFVAISIVLYSLHYLINKKIIKYVLLIIMAAMFHKTAIIMIPLYYLINRSYKRVEYLIITILAFLSLIFQNNIKSFLIETFYSQYQDTDFIYQNITSIYYAIICAVLLMLTIYLLYNNKMSLLDPKDNAIVNIVLLITLMHTFLTWVPLSNRISLYLDIFLIIIIPLYISYIDSRVRKVFALSVITVFFLSSAYKSLDDNVNGVLPYQSTLSEKRYY